MNEREFGRALHGAMATIEAPPPMNGTEVLDAAKRAQRRRRATMAGVASAAVVTAIAVGTMAGAELPDSGGGPIGPVSDPVETVNPREEASARLFDLLIESVPDGMQVPVDQATHQARSVGGGSVGAWMYTARTIVGRDGRWGTLLVDVYTAGNAVEGDGCDLKVRWLSGPCTLVAVGAKRVAVTTGAGGPEFEQIASYRHPDGTVVSVAQSKHAWLGPLPSLEVEPLTAQVLAALAADPKFRLE